MQVESPEKIRNVAVAGHNDTGKTTLVSALVYAGGVSTRLNRVEDGNTVTDFDHEEVVRKISIGLATCFVPWRQHKVNLIDCPGYGIFFTETRQGMRAADSVLLAVNAVAGVEVNTEKVWSYAEEIGLPVMIHLSKMDRERADFSRALEGLQKRFGRGVLPVQVPIGSEAGFTGVVDLVEGKIYRFTRDGNGKVEPADLPSDLTAELTEAGHLRAQLVEAVAETDDKLMEGFFENGNLDHADLVSGLRRAIARRQIFPVVVGAEGHGIGSSSLLDSILGLLPSPADRDFPATNVGGEPLSLAADPAAPVAALVFKTLSDPFSGKISILRVVSGTLRSDSTAYNPRTEESERLGHLLALQGKTGSGVQNLIAGDIGGVAKLKSTHSGDTLCAKERPVKLGWIHLPEPAMAFAVEPKSKHRSHVEVILHPPKVPYRETIAKVAEGHGRHKKQTGGRGQFADCKIKMEPLGRGEDFSFKDEIFGGAIPLNFRPAVEKGIQEARRRGYLAGYPVVDFKVRLLDGQFHDVDSSEMAFKIAGSLAFKDAMAKASPTLLEPIMKVEITTTEEFMGDIMGDLSQRRGRPQGMDAQNGNQVIKATVPMSEMLNYAQTLRSMTQGRSSFHMEFSHYEEVPRPVQEKIVAEAAKHRKAEQEEH